MPVKACAAPGCRTLVALGTARCPAHAEAEQLERWARGDDARAGEPWRRWYGLKRWRDLKEFVHRRDGWRCQWPGCETLVVRGRRDPRAAVADHIMEHRGDPLLFWSAANLQTLCKRHHDVHKARLEARRRAPAPTRGGGSNPYPAP